MSDPALFLTAALIAEFGVLTWYTIDLYLFYRRHKKWNRETAEALALVNEERRSPHHPSIYDQRCTNPNCALCRRIHGEL